MKIINIIVNICVIIVILLGILFGMTLIKHKEAQRLACENIGMKLDMNRNHCIEDGTAYPVIFECNGCFDVKCDVIFIKNMEQQEAFRK